MQAKAEEKSRLLAMSEEIDKKNDAMKLVYEQLQMRENEGVALLRARKQAGETELLQHNAILECGALRHNYSTL
eukprot:CAMPEP_0179462044 /NCGR_PEP_ID=MMETSP0799-20121207/44552_1 /TAXON_ID=46947 /ORGANISM="Geminigera cryophila, Strain CCMP2564" /LENGTH=73 /DNA_ID=CAMNT_0021264817 /DNA_START=62 /DNA_END=283 /DNA_ORIENTATION=+